MVPRLFPDSLIVCAGSGPSLVPADIVQAKAAGAKILAVNSAYQACPETPDVLFAADQKWWGWHPDAVALPIPKFSFHPTAIDGVTTLDWLLGDGLSWDPTRLIGGGHSGYAAVNLAALLGARRILLLGYDMAPSPAGAHHFHPDHPDGSHLQYPYRRSIYQTLLRPLSEHGITLINVSRRTAIPSVRRGTLSKSLQEFACCQ